MSGGRDGAFGTLRNCHPLIQNRGNIHLRDGLPHDGGKGHSHLVLKGTNKVNLKFKKSRKVKKFRKVKKSRKVRKSRKDKEYMQRGPPC